MHGRVNADRYKLQLEAQRWARWNGHKVPYPGFDDKGV